MKKKLLILFCLILQVSIVATPITGNGEPQNTNTDQSKTSAASNEKQPPATQSNDSIARDSQPNDTTQNNPTEAVIADTLITHSPELAKAIADKVIAMTQQPTDSIAVDSALLASEIAKSIKLKNLIDTRSTKGKSKAYINFVADSTKISQAIVDSIQRSIHFRSMVDSVGAGVVILESSAYQALKSLADAPDEGNVWKVLTWVGLGIVLCLIAVIVWLVFRKPKAAAETTRESNDANVTIAEPCKIVTLSGGADLNALDDFVLKTKNK